MNWKTEPINAATVQDAIDILFDPDPFLDDNHQDDQLYGHDFLHALLQAKTNSDTGEEIVAIYQAVLLGKVDAATAKPSAAWINYGAPPSLEQIHSITIPTARDFVNETVERLKKEHDLDDATRKKFEVRNYLTPEQITEHYQKALILRRLFEEELQRSLGEIPIRELATMPFPPFQALIPRMERTYSLTGSAQRYTDDSRPPPPSGSRGWIL